MADPITLYQDDEALAEQLAAGLRTHPQPAADALKAIVEEARCRAATGDFALIRDLADHADEAVEQVRAEVQVVRSTIASVRTRSSSSPRSPCHPKIWVSWPKTGTIRSRGSRIAEGEV